MLRLIRPGTHFVQDCFVAALLLVAPFFLPLGTLAWWLSVLGGASLLIYNALTDRPGSLWPAFPEKVHMVFDYAGVAALLVLPWILFEGPDRMYFFSIGVVTFVLAALVDFTPDPRPARPVAPRLLRYAFTQGSALVLVFAVFWARRTLLGA